MSSNRIEMIGICSEEEKPLLLDELLSIGATDVIPSYKAVYFSLPSYTLFYKIHFKIKTASKFLLILKRSRLQSPTESEITSLVSSIQWKNIFDPNRTFTVEGVPADRNQKGLSSNQISKAVRLAMQAKFLSSYGTAPKVDLKNPNLKFVAYLSSNNFILSVDTCGISLHKRGYRTGHHPCPIKETLASSILKILGYDGSTVLFDPFMGSGTFLIEAGCIAQHHYPLLERKESEFGFSYLNLFNQELFKKVKKQLKEEAQNQPSLIYGSDICSRYVKEAKENLAKSHLYLKNIHVKTDDFFSTQKPAPTGLMVSNLPYGERLSHDQSIDASFYKRVGDKLKKDFENWTIALLVAQDTPYKMIGLKPSSKYNFINGGIKVKLLIFEMYQGSKKTSKNKAS